MGRVKHIETTVHVDLSEWDDEDLIEEIKERNLESEFTAQASFENDEIARQKTELFQSKMHLINIEQWRFILKGVERCDKDQRSRLPKDYSDVLNETVA